jgi:hypothetical protein
MKPGEPLKRTPLVRKTPLKSGSSLRSSTPSADGSGKSARRKTGKHVGEAAARKAVAERSGGDCETRIFGVCLGRATNWHHRQNRDRKSTRLNSSHK